MLICVGTYSPASGPGIHILRWDSSENKFKEIEIISGIENPSYLHWDPSGILYAMTENKEGNQAHLFSYLISKNGTPKLLNQSAYKGAGSCYIQVNKSQRHAFIANYGDGSLTVIGLREHQGTSKVIQQISFSGRGADPERQEKSHIHAAVLSNDERYLYCSDLGADRIYRFGYQPDVDVPLTTDDIPYISLPAGSGPRHMAFSKCGRWLYLVTELSAEIFVFDLNQWGSPYRQRLELTQSGYVGKREGADLELDPSGKLLYATNRGDANEIITFTIQEDGQLEFLQRVGAAGLSPRSLLICEQEELVLVANEQSDNISIFRRYGDGTLEFSKDHLSVKCPTCIKELINL